MEINYDWNIWKVKPKNPSLDEYLKFSFLHIKSPSLKKQIKDYFWNELKTGELSPDSLHRYCYSLEHFSKFLKEYKYNVKLFDELTFNMVQQFIFYLNITLKSSNTRIVALCALKSIIRYGQYFNINGYPKDEIFPRTYSRSVKHEDELKTKEISQDLLEKILDALEYENDEYIKLMIKIAYETGLRISEIITLEEDCIIYDFLGNPILVTFSFKNKKERAIPISIDLEKSINSLSDKTAIYRAKSNSKYIFTYMGSDNNIRLYSQKKARIRLAKFIAQHNLTDSFGLLAKITFHQFRHSLGSNMINNGADPLDVKEMLGHESLHSTGLYAKIRDITLERDYKKMGFVGIVLPESSKDFIDEDMDEIKSLKGALPDGICKKVFEGDKMCNSFNKCLLCPKFITTPKYINIHKLHLKRIREDRLTYMEEMYICNLEKVSRIEAALVEIIESLEGLSE